MPPGAVIKSAAPIVVAKTLKFSLRGGGANSVGGTKFKVSQGVFFYIC